MCVEINTIIGKQHIPHADVKHTLNGLSHLHVYTCILRTLVLKALDHIYVADLEFC